MEKSLNVNKLFQNKKQLLFESGKPKNEFNFVGFRLRSLIALILVSIILVVILILNSNNSKATILNQNDELSSNVIESLESEKPEEQMKALKTLAYKLPKQIKKVFPRLMQLLEQGNNEVKSSILMLLTSIGSEAAGAVPHLMKFVKNPQDPMFSYAVKAIASIGSEAKQAAPELIIHLKNNYKTPSPLLYSLIRALKNFGAASKEAIPEILYIFKNKGYAENLRYYAVEALGEIGIKDKEIVTVLLKTNEASKMLYLGAAIALSKIAPEEKSTIPYLVEVISTETPNVLIKYEAAYALVRLEYAEVDKLIQILLHPLKHPDGRLSRNVSIGFSVPIEAINSLGKLGPKAKEAEPYLVKMLEHKEEGIREAAKDALTKIMGKE